MPLAAVDSVCVAPTVGSSEAERPGGCVGESMCSGRPAPSVMKISRFSLASLNIGGNTGGNSDVPRSERPQFAYETAGSSQEEGELWKVPACRKRHQLRGLPLS